MAVALVSRADDGGEVGGLEALAGGDGEEAVVVPGAVHQGLEQGQVAGDLLELPGPLPRDAGRVVAILGRVAQPGVDMGGVGVVLQPARLVLPQVLGIVAPVLGDEFLEGGVQARAVLGPAPATVSPPYVLPMRLTA